MCERQEWKFVDYGGGIGQMQWVTVEYPCIEAVVEETGVSALVVDAGLVLGGLVAAVMVLVLAMLVVKSAARWFRGV